MSTLIEDRDAEVKAARAIVDGAKAQVRDLTPEEVETVQTHLGKAAATNAQLKSAEERSALLKTLAEFTDAGAEEPRAIEPNSGAQAKSLAEHFQKSGALEQIRNSKGSRFSVSVPEYKAASDPLLESGTGGLATTYGGVYQTLYRRLTIADLLSSGTLSSPTLTYWTQGTVTGAFTAVAEGAAKPSLNFAFGQTTENLRKLAGVTKVSDEMTEDADYLVSVVRSQLIQLLQLVEEDQLLNGNGTAPNIRGLLNRTGIQTYATSSTFTVKKGMDAIFHAMTLIRTGSYLEPDGIVINPTDYETLRLGQDANSQYYGGGPFTGAYGVNGVQQQPGLWGLNTVVTPAIAAGTVLVGSFKMAGQVFRKGGIRLESTNSNEDDFKNNLVAIRAEERLALAVYYPTSLVKVTLTA